MRGIILIRTDKPEDFWSERLPDFDYRINRHSKKHALSLDELDNPHHVDADDQMSFEEAVFGINGITLEDY